MTSAVAIRSVRADEWAALRAVRLRALQDSPDAFGSTYAREETLPEGAWRERTESSAMGADGVTLIAAIEDGWIGMTMSRLDREDATVAGLYGLWVAPSARRAGIGRRLVAAAAAWARERGARRMVLLVVASNADAVALYRQAGFVETERTIPLPRDPSIVEIEMELTLDW